jgi:hypothetical protein
LGNVKLLEINEITNIKNAGINPLKTMLFQFGVNFSLPKAVPPL